MKGYERESENNQFILWGCMKDSTVETKYHPLSVLIDANQENTHTHGVLFAYCLLISPKRDLRLKKLSDDIFPLTNNLSFE